MVFSGFSDAEKNIPGYLINPPELLLFLQTFYCYSTSTNGET